MPHLKLISSLGVAAALLATPNIAAATHADILVDPIPTGNIKVALQPVATGLTSPLYGTYAPGDPNHLYVVDQPGALWSINLTTGAKSVILDASGLLATLGVFGGESFDERGLLGIAFHPNFQSNGRLYTFTSEPNNGAVDFSTMPAGTTANHVSVIREWTSPSPYAVIDPGSSRVLMRIDQPQFNHNSGALSFGPDGYLYAAVGDGGGADDQADADMQMFIEGPPLNFLPIVGHGQNGNGQNPGNILGNILRIDVDGNNAPNGQYGIPADNPFVPGAGDAMGGEAGCADGWCDEIYAYGFRNPYRMSVDQVTGAVILGDVGQNDIEEVDIVLRGGNYGWPLKEGSWLFDHNGDDGANGLAFPSRASPNVPHGMTDPVAEYDHGEGVSVIGGFVYRGNQVGGLLGRYIFGEFSNVGFDPTVENCNGRLHYLQAKVDEGNMATDVAANNFDGQMREFPGDVLGDRCLLGFGQDAGGEIYVLVNSRGVPFGATGAVYKIVRK